MAARAKRLGLAALMTLAALNVWTGGPLAALWIGSRVQGEGPPSMAAIFTAAGSLAAISIVLVRVLSGLGSAYDRLTGTNPTVRRHVPWLRSMRGERPQYEGENAAFSLLEVILVLMVVIAFVAFEIWFFFFSPSPIDQRTGRE